MTWWCLQSMFFLCPFAFFHPFCIRLTRLCMRTRILLSHYIQYINVKWSMNGAPCMPFGQPHSHEHTHTHMSYHSWVVRASPRLLLISISSSSSSSFFSCKINLDDFINKTVWLILLPLSFYYTSSASPVGWVVVFVPYIDESDREWMECV